MPVLYLDVCCLNRPFDDQRQDRIRLEAQAIERIMERLYMQEWEWIGSDVIELEISKTPDPERRHRVTLLASSMHRRIVVSTEEEGRATRLRALGFSGVDALHLACAERGGADVFLTTDDKLLRLALRHVDALKIEVANPLAWLQKGDK
jgi:predicted nucleic acid-binding protein